MSSITSAIYSVAAVRAIDRCAIEDHGIPGYTLMSAAGAAAMDFAEECFPACRNWLLICGAGNNAGDGYVVARLAANRGIRATVVTVSAPEKLRGDARTAWQDFIAEGGETSAWDGRIDADADLIIDAMLGSGLERDVEGDYAQAVTAINASGKAVLALDIPTGINGDSGAVMGTAVRADATITFVGLKQGLLLGEGPDYCGQVAFAGLDVPDECHPADGGALRRIDIDSLKARLGIRSRQSHKGAFGHVLVIGGGPGMPGAARLCGEAALRTGAGLVSLATHPTHAAAIAAARPELICHPVTGAADLAELLERASVVALGPGLGRTDWAREVFAAAIETGLPLVIDADGLNLLAERPDRRPSRILTPHPGEAARMLGTSAAEVQADRVGALRQLEARYGGTVVLKGAGSLVSSASGKPWISMSGNPGMASAGMGDVLTGIIAGLLAQGLDAEEAAALGVELHAVAGDCAASSGERGILASDLIEELRPWLNP
jgi:NAD(P)H-hydrate epimerase